VPGGAGQTAVAGYEWDAQGFGEGDKGGVVRREVVAELPDAVTQLEVWVADQNEVPKVGAGIRRPLIRQLSAGVEAPQGMQTARRRTLAGALVNLG
jgi:hypothetical protein